MKKQNVFSIERFNPDYKVGLTEEQLNSRIQNNLVNQNTKNTRNRFYRFSWVIFSRSLIY